MTELHIFTSFFCDPPADVTLDPDTANPWLQLSQDRRQVRHLGAWQDLPDNPSRFDTVVIALGREGFAAGRHYWEVTVGEKDDWYLGVAKSSVNRKGRISVSTAQGYWALAMKKGQEYRASTRPALPADPRPATQARGRVRGLRGGPGVVLRRQGPEAHLHVLGYVWREGLALLLPVLLRQGLRYHGDQPGQSQVCPSNTPEVVGSDEKKKTMPKNVNIIS